MTRRAITYVKVELLNVDGSVMGFARIMPSDRVLREALYETMGADYEARMVIPPGPKGDPRCPYAIRIVVEQ